MNKSVEQQINAPVYGHVAGGNVTVNQHGQVAEAIHHHHTGNHGTYVTVVNIHVHTPSHAPPLPGHARASTAHRRALTLLDLVPDRIAVLDFMEREFGTRMVIELDTRQLYRLRRYVEVILKSGGPP